MAAPGKPYGLIFPKKGAQKVLVKHSVFTDDSDEEASVSESLQREALKKQAMKQTKLEIQRALAEDSTVYEYDAIYEDIQQKKAETQASSLAGKVERKPKYIQNILQAAELRKKEQEKRMEKKIQKEREMEGDAFEDKEAFVTSAYKKKLQERAEEEERERREAAAEACLDVTKQKDLSGFYRHLLNQAVGEEKMPHCSLREARLKEEDVGEETPHPRNRTLEETARACLPVQGGGGPDTEQDLLAESSEEENGTAKGPPDSRRGDKKGVWSRGSDHGRTSSKHRQSPRESRSSGEEESSPSGQAEPGNPRRKSSRERRPHRPSKAEQDQTAGLPRRQEREEEEEEKDHRHGKRGGGEGSGKKDREQQKHGGRTEEGDPPSPEEPSEGKHKPAKDRTPAADMQSKFARRSNQESVSSARDRYLARQVARGGSRPYVEKEED